MTFINYKNEHIWQSYIENVCNPNFVSNLDTENLNIIFVRDQAGEKFESSNPETAELNLSFDSIDCGVAYFVKSNSVPYFIADIVGSNYKEDNGRIQLGAFPVQFELTQNTGNCQLGHGTYKITTLFKFDRPTYKNKEAGYTIQYDPELEQWKMCPDLEQGDESCCVSDVVTGPYEEIAVPTPTPTPDVTPPGIPAPTTTTPTTDRTPTWTWNAVSGNPVSYDVKIDGIVFTNQTTLNFTPSSDLSDGFYTINVRSKDASGNVSDWGTHTVEIDATAPDIPAPTTTTPTTDRTPTWTWNAVSGNPVSYDVQLGSGSVTNQAGRTYTPSSNLSDGSHTIKVRAKDALGNTSGWGTHTVVIDATAPGIPAPTTATPTTDRTPTWTWNTVSGNPVSYDVQLNSGSITNQTDLSYTSPSNLSDGSHTIKVRAKDALGNTSGWGTHTVVIDTIAPGVPEPLLQPGGLPSGSTTTERTLTWSWNVVFGDPVSYDVQLNSGSITNQTTLSYTSPSNLSDGSHTIQVRAIDEAGNKSGWGTHTVIIDTTAPGIPAPTTTTPTTDRTPTWSWNKPSGNPISYRVSLNGGSIISQTSLNFTPSSNLSDGSHTIQVRAIDEAGNKSGWGTHTVIIDTTPPGIPAPTTTTPTTDRTPTWTWNAVSGNPASYDVQLGSGSITNQTTRTYTPSSNLSDGSHTIKVRAKDALGNTSGWGTHTVVIDATAPGVPDPSTESPTRDRTPTWSWNAVSGNPVSYDVQLNSGSITNQTTRTYTPSSNLSDGSHTIKVRAKDALGNTSGWGTHTVKIDNMAPDVPVPLLMPGRLPNGATTTDTTPTWEWDAVNDNPSGFPISYEVAFIASNLIQTPSSWTTQDASVREWTHPTPLAVNSKGRIYVRAVDSVGNKSDWGMHLVTIKEPLFPKVGDVVITPKLYTQEPDKEYWLFKNEFALTKDGNALVMNCKFQRPNATAPDFGLKIIHKNSSGEQIENIQKLLEGGGNCGYGPNTTKTTSKDADGWVIYPDDSDAQIPISKFKWDRIPFVSPNNSSSWERITKHNGSNYSHCNDQIFLSPSNNDIIITGRAWREVKQLGLSGNPIYQAMHLFEMGTLNLGTQNNITYGIENEGRTDEYKSTQIGFWVDEGECSYWKNRPNVSKIELNKFNRLSYESNWDPSHPQLAGMGHFPGGIRFGASASVSKNFTIAGNPSYDWYSLYGPPGVPGGPRSRRRKFANLIDGNTISIMPRNKMNNTKLGPMPGDDIRQDLELWWNYHPSLDAQDYILYSYYGAHEHEFGDDPAASSGYGHEVAIARDAPTLENATKSNPIFFAYASWYNPKSGWDSVPYDGVHPNDGWDYEGDSFDRPGGSTWDTSKSVVKISAIYTEGGQVKNMGINRNQGETGVVRDQNQFGDTTNLQRYGHFAAHWWEHMYVDSKSPVGDYTTTEYADVLKISPDGKILAISNTPEVRVLLRKNITVRDHQRIENNPNPTQHSWFEYEKVQTLTVPDGETVGSTFGCDIDFDGTWLAVGDSFNRAVYLYKWNNTTGKFDYWNKIHNNSDEFETFGLSVCFDTRDSGVVTTIGISADSSVFVLNLSDIPKA
jgi:hypothetical protein